MPSDYPNKKELIDKIKYENIHSKKFFKEISETHKTTHLTLIGTIIINEKKQARTEIWKISYRT